MRPWGWKQLTQSCPEIRRQSSVAGIVSQGTYQVQLFFEVFRLLASFLLLRLQIFVVFLFVSFAHFFQIVCSIDLNRVNVRLFLKCKKQET